MGLSTVPTGQGTPGRDPFVVGSAGWTRSIPVDFIEREISPGVTQTLKTLAYDRMGVILWECTRLLLARVEVLEERVAQLSAP